MGNFTENTRQIRSVESVILGDLFALTRGQASHCPHQSRPAPTSSADTTR